MKPTYQDLVKHTERACKLLCINENEFDRLTQMMMGYGYTWSYISGDKIGNDTVLFTCHPEELSPMLMKLANGRAEHIEMHYAVNTVVLSGHCNQGTTKSYLCVACT